MTAVLKDIQPKIGEGIFLTKDIAQILNLPYPKVRYWMLEIWDNKFGHGRLYSFGDKGNKAINFYTLIEFYTFSQLRQMGVSAKEIKKAHQTISKELDTEYPFAMHIRTDGKKVWYEHLGELIKADGRMQLDLKAILEPFLKKVEFGKSNLAERFYPSESKNVVVDPQHQFGQPTISGTNIRVDVVGKLSDGGESVRNISILYDLTVPQVRDAVRFYKKTA